MFSQRTLDMGIGQSKETSTSGWHIALLVAGDHDLLAVRVILSIKVYTDSNC